MFEGPLPSRRDERWTVLREAIGEWFPEPLAGEHAGCTIDEIRAVERRLRARLPAALKELYLSTGNRADVWSVQDELVAPSSLALEDDRLVFFREAQNVVEWSIRRSDLALCDPPVYVRDLDNSAVHHREAADVTTFTLQMLALNAKFAAKTLFRANGQSTNTALRELARSFVRLPFGDLHWPPFPTYFLGNRQLIVEVQAHTWIWVTATTRHAFQHAARICEATGVTWEAIEES